MNRRIESLKELFVDHKMVLSTIAPITWTPIRDISTAELKGDTVIFKTKINKLFSEHKIGYTKKEILTFDTEQDAEHYFYLETKELLIKRHE